MRCRAGVNFCKLSALVSVEYLEEAEKLICDAHFVGAVAVRRFGMSRPSVLKIYVMQRINGIYLDA